MREIFYTFMFILLSVLIVVGISEVNAADSTNLGPGSSAAPSSTTTQIYQCFGSPTTNGASYSTSGYDCNSGSTQCNSPGGGEFAIGVGRGNHTDSWGNTSSSCYTICQKITSPVSNCKWN